MDRGIAEPLQSFGFAVKHPCEVDVDWQYCCEEDERSSDSGGEIGAIRSQQPVFDEQRKIHRHCLLSPMDRSVAGFASYSKCSCDEHFQVRVPPVDSQSG